ncbi:MAG: LysR substrate-binding domain-containing protein [Parvularculaceae bacterium]
MPEKSNLNRLTYFVAIVDEGSITAAAKRLQISKAVVSKQLILLEEELNATLIIRNSRNQTLTSTGQALYTSASDALSMAQDALKLVRAGSQLPTGTLKIGATPDFGSTVITQVASAVSAKYPELLIELSLSEQRIDVVRSGLDVSFRVGWLRDSTNIARKLLDMQQYIVCSPDLLTRHTAPTSPKTLAQLPFVENRALTSSRIIQLQNKNGQRVDIEVRPNVSVDMTLASKMAALSGGGIAVLPDFLVNTEINEGALVRLLPGWELKRGGVYAVFPPTSFRSAATEIFLEILQKHITE